MTDMQRVFAVRAHARAHDDGGWDILKKVWTNQDIAGATRGAATPQECVARIGKTLRIIDDIRDAIQSECSNGMRTSATARIVELNRFPKRTSCRLAVHKNGWSIDEEAGKTEKSAHTGPLL